MARKKSRRGPRAPALQPVTPEDLREFQIVSAPQISPDGTSLVFVRKRLGDRNRWETQLMRVAAGGRQEAQEFTQGPGDSRPCWSPDGRRVAFVRKPEGQAAQVHRIDADGGEARALTAFPEGTVGPVRWAPDGRHLAVAFRPQDPDWTEAARKQREETGASEPPRVVDDWWYRLDGDGYFNAQRFALYLVDAETGTHRKLFDKDRLGTFSFDFAPDGRRLAVTCNRHPRALVHPEKVEVWILDLGTGRHEVVRGLPAGPKSTLRWSPDGRWLAFAGRAGTDGEYSVENLELWICDPVRGTARSLTGQHDYCLLAPPLSDAAEVAFDVQCCWAPDSRRVYLGIGWHGQQRIASVDRVDGALRFHSPATRDVALGSLSDDGRRMAVRVGSWDRLPEVHVARTGSGTWRTTARTAFNTPWMRQRRLSRPRAHWLDTPHGGRVQVWELPRTGGRARGRGPAVLEVHGGPHAQYGTGFFHEFQVLAAAGYTVFFSNPRGSKGYGRDHCAAIRGRWGHLDWMDVQAVTEFMRSRPPVDPARIGIMGGSYGGYMTNWAIGHSRDYKAAITDRCVSNLVTLLGTGDIVEAPDSYFPGNIWDRTEDLDAQSPLRYFGAVKTPTLILHSEGDLRCNIEQAEQTFAALKMLGVPTRLVRYPRSTSHGMSRSGPADLRVHRLQQILEWWKRWL